jgi:hypothetical protein
VNSNCIKPIAKLQKSDYEYKLGCRRAPDRKNLKGQLANVAIVWSLVRAHGLTVLFVQSDSSIWQSSVVRLHCVAVLCGQTPLCGCPLWSDSTLWQPFVVRLHRVEVLCGQTTPFDNPLWSDSTVWQSSLIRLHRVAVLCGQMPPCCCTLLSDATVWLYSVVRRYRVAVLCGQTPLCGSPP